MWYVTVRPYGGCCPPCDWCVSSGVFTDVVVWPRLVSPLFSSPLLSSRIEYNKTMKKVQRPLPVRSSVRRSLFQFNNETRVTATATRKTTAQRHRPLPLHSFPSPFLLLQRNLRFKRTRMHARTHAQGNITLIPGRSVGRSVGRMRNRQYDGDRTTGRARANRKNTETRLE